MPSCEGRSDEVSYGKLSLCIRLNLHYFVHISFLRNRGSDLCRTACFTLFASEGPVAGSGDCDVYKLPYQFDSP